MKGHHARSKRCRKEKKENTERVQKKEGTDEDSGTTTRRPGEGKVGRVTRRKRTEVTRGRTVRRGDGKEQRLKQGRARERTASKEEARWEQRVLTRVEQTKDATEAGEERKRTVADKGTRP